MKIYTADSAYDLTYSLGDLQAYRFPLVDKNGFPRSYQQQIDLWDNALVNQEVILSISEIVHLCALRDYKRGKIDSLQFIFVMPETYEQVQINAFINDDGNV